MYLKRGDKYWLFYGSEKNIIKNGAWILEKSISLFHGKTNPIRYFSVDELNQMKVECDCNLHGRYDMYPGSWEGRAVLVKLLELPEKVSSELVRKVVGSLTSTHGNSHMVVGHRMGLRIGGLHGNVQMMRLCALPDQGEEEEELLELLREIVVGSQMGTHSNVHKLLGCCLETELPVLVYEWIENETLEDRILLVNKNQKKQPLEWKDRLRIAWEISHAIAYLHTAFPRPIIHTHLTPKSVLLDNNIARLYNFGSSVSIPEGEEFVKLGFLRGTSGYMAPEYSDDYHVAESIDVYSFGMLFLMLLTARKVSEQTQNSIGLKEWVLEGIKHKCVSEIVDSAITRNGVTAIEELQLRASIHLALSCVVKEAYCRPTMVKVATELKNMITSPESISSTSTIKGKKIHRIFNRSEDNLMHYKLVLQEYFSVNPIHYFSVHELNTMNVEHDQIFQYCYQGSWEGRSILVKLQNEVTIDSSEIPSSFLREIVFATVMDDHSNVQKLLGCCLETKFPVLVYESVTAETLEDRISPKDENQKRLPPLAWKDRLRIAWEISHTVSYFHTAFPMPIIHGNLMPKNIFLDQHGSVKLSNINHYIFLEGEELGVKDCRIETISGVTKPEYFKGCLVAECVDVYSFGLLFLVLLTGKNYASVPSTSTTDHISTNLIHWVIKAVRMERISEIIDPAINKNVVTTIELRASVDLALRCTTSLVDCRPTMADVATELKRMISSHESIPCSISFQGNMYRSFRGSKEYFMQNEAFVLEENISLFHDRARPICYFSVDQLNNMNIEYYSYEAFWDGLFKWYQGSWEGRVVWVKLPITLFDMESLASSHCITQILLHEVVIATQMATHNNVHKLLGCCLETKVPVLVYECLAEDITLEDRILLKDENQNKLPVLEWKDRLRIALQLSQVASHLHKSFPRPMIHRCLRPCYVFLDQDNTVKLSNFRSSVSIPEGKNFVQDSSFGYSFYMEPEYYEQGEVGECTDVYSFGILFLVLLTGKSADFSSTEGHIRSAKLSDWVTEKFRKVCVSKIVDPAIAEIGVSTAEMTASIKLALKCTAKRDKRPTMGDVATELEKIIRSSDLPNGFSRLRGPSMYMIFHGSNEYYMQNESILHEESNSLFFGKMNLNPIQYFSVDELCKMKVEYHRINWNEDYNWHQGSWEGSVVFVKLPKSYASRKIRLLLREILVATQMESHVNVQRLIGCCLETKYPVLVCESVAEESLEDRVLLKGENQIKPVLEWKERLRIAREISHVVSHLHNAFHRPIIHRRLETANIFLDLDNNVKLSNFCRSISIPEGQNFLKDFDDIGRDNSYYTESDKDERIRVAECTDVYSFGIIFLVLLTGKPARLNNAEGVRGTPLINWVTEKFKKVNISEIVDPAIVKSGVTTTEMTASIKLALRCTAKRDKGPTMVDVATELKKIIRLPDLPNNSFSLLRGCLTS